MFACLLVGLLFQQSHSTTINFNNVIVHFGSNLGSHVRDRIHSHLQQVVGPQMVTNPSSPQVPPIGEQNTSTLILCLGNASVPSIGSLKDAVETLPPESYVLQSQRLAEGGFVIAVDGTPLNHHTHTNITLVKDAVHYGAVLGVYAVLEKLGFGFLHPLEPYRPQALSWMEEENYFHKESPYWPERGFHVHTQHPLEITEVLQGHDIPMFGPHGKDCMSKAKDASSGQYCERWDDMVGNVDSFFEWGIANRLNKIEWLLLGNYKWGNLDHSGYRQKRLKVLVELGHSYSLLIGADVPLGNIQQHGWTMVSTRVPFDQQRASIESRVDWVLGAGFDFMTTESGLSEFTHPECKLMLDLLNAFAGYVNGTWGREAATKVHCSTGQVCDDFYDIRTGDPINFNFLTMYATKQLGVFPHTVQMYGLDDPTGGTYGNNDFSYIEDYMFFEASRNRSAQYYGETSYWVNVDIDVPLFLPIYGQRRLHDLRRIAEREIRTQIKVSGQMNFDSGWEWGYWISDVVTARASWNPQMEIDDTWVAFEKALMPLQSIFRGSKINEEFGSRLVSILVNLTRIQEKTLIFGEIDGEKCKKLDILSGIAYLSGTDTWYELPAFLGLHTTQSSKVKVSDSSHENFLDVLAILAEMDRLFGKVYEEISQIAKISGVIESDACPKYMNGVCSDKSGEMPPDPEIVLTEGQRLLVSEIYDCIEVLYLRTIFVRHMYESRQQHLPSSEKQAYLTQGRHILLAASESVERREKGYRTPLQRVAGWRENPTVYRYGYLWAVHRLYYWWRDFGVADALARADENARLSFFERLFSPFQPQLSFCYLNRMDVTEVTIGWGKQTLQFIRNILDALRPFTHLGFHYPMEISRCVASPLKEYIFPRDLVPQ
jgi:hypothetical protein